MMKIQPFLYITLLLTAFSCEQAETSEVLPEERTTISFPLDTKGLPEGSHTFRVALTGIDGKLMGTGTYCSDNITPGVKGTWLSPCRVDLNGEPLDSNGESVTSFADADKDGFYGLRYPNRAVGVGENVYISAASPAVQLHNQGNRAYYLWKADKELYLSGKSDQFLFNGSWLNKEYVFSFSDKDALQLIDRRAKLFVHIECGEQDHADIQSIILTSVSEARWYLPDGFANSNYTKSSQTLYSWNNIPSQIMHLDKIEGDVWDSDANGIYLLPLNYSVNDYNGMLPSIALELGADTTKPINVNVEITEEILPMKNYLLNLYVSKSYVTFELLASDDWDNGGTFDSEDEELAMIAVGVAEAWDTTGSESTTDDWNTTL